MEIMTIITLIALILLVYKHNTLVHNVGRMEDGMSRVLDLTKRYVDDRVSLLTADIPSGQAALADRKEIRALREDLQNARKKINEIDEELNRTLAIMDSMSVRTNGIRNLLGMLANSHNDLQKKVNKTKKHLLRKISKCRRKRGKNEQNGRMDRRKKTASGRERSASTYIQKNILQKKKNAYR